MTELARTPLYDWHVENQGRMVDFAGWEMPVQYESIVKEHQATRTGIGLFDISHMGRLRFDGPDAGSFLHRLLTRAVAPIPAGGIRYGLCVNASGGVLDDVLVYRLSDENGEFYLLVVNASNREKIVAWIGEQVRADEAIGMRDLTPDTGMFAVQGPKAVALGDTLCGVRVSDLKYYSGVVNQINIDGQSIDAVISRTGYTGEDGFELIVDGADAAQVWGGLMNAGASDGIRAIGLGARDTLRLEAAMPLYGHELSEEINPIEVGLRFAVQLKNHEFIGAEALRGVAAQGATRKRIGLALDGRRAPREGYGVFDAAGKQVGIVTSGTFSPTLQHPIAMAMVDADAPNEGLQVDIRGKMFDCRIVELPFYSRPKTS